jgi:hypothetical protein
MNGGHAALTLSADLKRGGYVYRGPDPTAVVTGGQANADGTMAPISD